MAVDMITSTTSSAGITTEDILASLKRLTETVQPRRPGPDIFVVSPVVWGEMKQATLKAPAYAVGNPDAIMGVPVAVAHDEAEAIRLVREARDRGQRVGLCGYGISPDMLFDLEMFTTWMLPKLEMFTPDVTSRRALGVNLDSPVSVEDVGHDETTTG